VALQTAGGRRTAEEVADLETWLRRLDDCPEITATVIARCTQEVHGAEPGTWFYVEADSDSSVARRRCLACGDVTHVGDSARHWNHAPMWCCATCGQSIAEVAYGLHERDGLVSWLAMGVRCVECGGVQGVTDMFVPNLSVEDLATRI